MSRMDRQGPLPVAQFHRRHERSTERWLRRVTRAPLRAASFFSAPSAPVPPGAVSAPFRTAVESLAQVTPHAIGYLQTPLSPTSECTAPGRLRRARQGNTDPARHGRHLVGTSLCLVPRKFFLCATGLPVCVFTRIRPDFVLVCRPPQFPPVPVRPRFCPEPLLHSSSVPDAWTGSLMGPYGVLELHGWPSGLARAAELGRPAPGRVPPNIS
eukprot:gene16675-biopygen3756